MKEQAGGSHGYEMVLRAEGHGCSPAGSVLSGPSPITSTFLEAPSGPTGQWHGLVRAGTTAV